MNHSPKRAVNVKARGDLVSEAKTLGINLVRIFLGSLVAAVLFAGAAARFAPYALGTGVVVAFTALSLLVLPQALHWPQKISSPSHQE